MKKSGFTLIELLVVISIMAIVAVALFLNFGSFDEEANLKNEAFNLQSYLRLAQANAQTGVKCPDGTGGIGWSIVLTDRVSNAVNLKCHTQSPYVRTWSLHFPAFIESVEGLSGTLRCSSSFTSTGTISQAITINFAYLSGRANFEDGDTINKCLQNSSNMVITLKKKLDSQDTKTITISRGGSVDAQ